jgi:glucose-1-phosphate cytidylyltransferase
MHESVAAVILCGGQGSRLREETEFRPKPMVTIGGKPVLWHIMKLYAHFGVKKFVLCLGYKGDFIKEWFYHYALFSHDTTIRLGRESSLVFHDTPSCDEDWSVTMVDTGDKAMKGARLKRIEKYVEGDTFLATYGDGVADIDVGALLAFHRHHGRIATLTGVRPPSLFGELQVEDGAVSLFVEKPQTSSGLINGGFFVFDRRIFDYLAADDGCDLERGPLERLAAQGELMVYRHDGLWACMDTYRDMEYLNELWRTDAAFWRVWDAR